MSDSEDIDLNCEFDLSNQLDLQIGNDLEDTDSDFSNLHKYLQEKIRLLTQQNGHLRRTLSDAQSELKRLNKKTDILNEQVKYRHTDITKASEAVGIKIIDLSKRNRQLNAELESYKTKCAKFENMLMIKKLKPEDIGTTSTETTSSEQETQNVLANENSTLKEKLNNTLQKLIDTRNQNASLKSDLKVAHKCLSQEIGDSVISVQNILGQPSNWRGRAQQIMSLQLRVSEMQEKLNSLTNIGEGDSKTSITKQVELQKKSAQENIVKELKDTKAMCEELRTKMNSTRARNKVLESECSSQKIRLQTLLQKTNHDDQFIEALNAQISKVTESFNSQLADKGKTIDKIEKEKVDLETEIAKWEIRMEKTKAIIVQKEKEIDDIKRQAEEDDGENNLPYNKAHYMLLSRAAEAEKFKLQELVEVLHTRNAADKTKLAECQHILMKERHRGAKLEKQVQKLELELKKNTSKSKLTKLAEKYKFGKHASSSAVGVTPGCPHNSACGSRLSESFVLEQEELKNRLEFANEENVALQERLQSVIHECTVDIDFYKQMMENTREVFRKSIHANRGHNTD